MVEYLAKSFMHAEFTRVFLCVEVTDGLVVTAGVSVT